MSRMGQYVIEQEMLLTEDQLWAREKDRHEGDEAAWAGEIALLRERGMPHPEAGVPVISEERLDLAALWQSLPDEDRAHIGELALGLIVGGLIGAHAESTAASASRAGDQCYHQSLEALSSEIPDSVVAAIRGPSWRIPALLGPVCLNCGCSQNDACADGCRWTDERRIECTACGRPEEHLPF
ncbi:hypothetical protein SAMN05216360_102469 [Methylobacterium phyllostachyos]|uniref:Uncharacterized protein n=1 Tax=Methylobacterium phyllostachyos TaxID=582672 RepID=A0A1G9UAD6_9HYPH|nr:hypothetical protein [Methylobacterium phyllostachyos]SDM56937.1 hypothetical protein SAMN05216360_102469 [Methylobacterium phyllostachyos]